MENFKQIYLPKSVMICSKYQNIYFEYFTAKSFFNPLPFLSLYIAIKLRKDLYP